MYSARPAVCFYVSAAHPTGRQWHYVFDLSVRVYVSAHGRAGEGILRRACRPILDQPVYCVTWEVNTCFAKACHAPRPSIIPSVSPHRVRQEARRSTSCGSVCDQGRRQLKICRVDRHGERGAYGTDWRVKSELRTLTGPTPPPTPHPCKNSSDLYQFQERPLAKVECTCPPQSTPWRRHCLRQLMGLLQLRHEHDWSTIRERYNILRGVMCFRAIMNTSILSRCCRML